MRNSSQIEFNQQKFCKISHYSFSPNNFSIVSCIAFYLDSYQLDKSIFYKIWTQMAISNLIKTYAEYSLYADKKIIHWLQEKPVELIDFQLPSSFSSIRKTLWHIHDTERFWLSILKGESINFDTEMPKDIEVFFVECIIQSELFSSYSTSLSDEALERTCAINQPWMKATMPKFEIIQHCINHSSYHRGQIITIARNAGISDIPMTDYAMYLVREIKKY